MTRAIATALCAGWVLAALPALAQDDMLPPQIVHEPCEFYKKGRKYKVMARFYDDSPIFDPKVLYRPRGDDNWKTAPFTKSGASEDFQAVIKGRDLKGPIEYFIETFDENGNGPARYGSPEAPVRLRPSDDPPDCVQVGEQEVAPTTFETSVDEPAGSSVAATPGSTRTRPQPLTATSGTAPPPPQDGCDGPDPPVHCSGLFWGGMILGLAVVAGGTVGILALTGAFDSEEPTGPRPDFVTLDIKGADPTVAPIITW